MDTCRWCERQGQERDIQLREFDGRRLQEPIVFHSKELPIGIWAMCDPCWKAWQHAFNLVLGLHYSIRLPAVDYRPPPPR